MSKFDAGTAVEPMEFDFSAYGGGTGVIREPSNKVYQQFMTGLTDVAKEFAPLKEKVNKLEGNDEEIEALVAELDLEGELDKMNTRIGEVVSKVTGGAVSVEDIANLPYRVQQAFISWLTGELNPERKAPGTNK